jgi:ferritin-like metal-binding protein YciE
MSTRDRRRETEGHVSRLEEVFEMIDKKPQGKSCAAQAVEHYEISRYGTLRTWAEELGLDDAASLLQETLDEEKATDEALTEIAEAVVNQEAEGAAAA